VFTREGILTASGTRSLLFVSPHFPPDSAAGSHRARIVAPYLAEFGWRPIVLTVDPQSVEGETDAQLAAAVDASLDIIRVKAWPHTWTRRAGFGDLGLRAYRPLRRVAVDLAHAKRVSATLVTTYPTYPALIGASLKRRLGVPFLLDLQDPWVGAWGKDVGPRGAPDLRSRASRLLATRLEVQAAGSADALLSVTKRTIDELASRVPAVADVPHLELPIGWEPADWARLRADRRPNGVFDRSDGHIHVCAVGTLLPTAVDGLKAFLEGTSQVVRAGADGQRLRIWFVGSSNERRVDAPAIVRPFVAPDLRDVVTELPSRLAYFDALRVLRDAHVVLVLGSSEPHYTPSRVFPALASRRPIVARLHRASPALRLLSSAGASRAIDVVDASLPAAEQAQAFAAALTRALSHANAADAADDAPLSTFTGRALAKRVAGLLNRVCT
jgi:glycosyltransferase involved in cell wall biosynthesis